MTRIGLLSISWIASASLVGWLVRVPNMQPVAPPAPALAQPAPSGFATASSNPTSMPSDRADAAATYVAMREDINPKPRLRLIEDWSRERLPGASLDLLTQAMVDPDDGVRARAQDLFERGLSADARRASEPIAIPPE